MGQPQFAAQVAVRVAVHLPGRVLPGAPVDGVGRGDGRHEAHRVTLAHQPEGFEAEFGAFAGPVVKREGRYQPRRTKPVAVPDALPGIGLELRVSQPARLLNLVGHVRHLGPQREAVAQAVVQVGVQVVHAEAVVVAPALALPPPVVGVVI